MSFLQHVTDLTIVTCLRFFRQHRTKKTKKLANTLRAAAAPAAQGEAPPPIDDLDHSDAEERSLAKEVHKI